MMFKYRAVDENNMPFLVAYGKNQDDIYVANSFKDLAKHIAYYNHRCYAKLQVLTQDGQWIDANKIDNDAFNNILDWEFFFDEIR